MKHIGLVGFLATVLGSFSLTAVCAEANVKIGTVDMQRALQTVKAGKDAKSTLEKEFNKRKDELKKEEAELKKMQEEIQKQASALSEKALAKKQHDFQERAVAFQEKLQKSQMEIQKKEADLTAPIVQRLKDLISEQAKKDGYTVVLEKNEQNVLFSLEQDDLTEKVISSYK